jgi:dTDP-4-dehydrorhamnose reductase
MKILLTGGSGQLGAELQAALAPLGAVLAPGRAEFDLAQPHTLAAQLEAWAPQLIVNAAAYTAVDKAEAEPELAHAINATAPGVLARWAAAHDVPLVHYSTDYVFGGELTRPYVETDLTGPLNVYGESKLAGEQVVLAANPQALVLRTSWVFSAVGNNFLKTMLRLAGERDQLKVVGDQIGAPTSTLLLARVTRYLLEQLLGKESNAWGLYHLTASGETSWHGYAQELIRQAQALGWPLKATPANIFPLASADWPCAAERPANSRLDCSLIERTFSLVLPRWQDGVAEVLAQLKD